MVKKDSTLDLAYEFLKNSNGEKSFKEIWDYVSSKLELESLDNDVERISKFYTNLTLDGRFVTLGENQWDLRTRQKFEKVHIDMNDVYAEEDLDDTEDEDDEEDSGIQDEIEEVI